MYLLEWHIVDGGFGLAEELEGAERESAGIGRNRRIVEDLADGGKVAAVLVLVNWRVLVLVGVRMIVVMMVMVVIMSVGRVGILAADKDAGLAGGDATAVCGLEDEGCAEIERCSGLLEERGRDAGVDKGAEQHVSTEAGEAFEIANAHGCSHLMQMAATSYFA
jgi:hypothetical protein